MVEDKFISIWGNEYGLLFERRVSESPKDALDIGGLGFVVSGRIVACVRLVVKLLLEKAAVRIASAGVKRRDRNDSGYGTVWYLLLGSSGELEMKCPFLSQTPVVP